MFTVYCNKIFMSCVAQDLTISLFHCAADVNDEVHTNTTSHLIPLWHHKGIADRKNKLHKKVNSSTRLLFLCFPSLKWKQHFSLKTHFFYKRILTLYNNPRNNNPLSRLSSLFCLPFPSPQNPKRDPPGLCGREDFLHHVSWFQWLYYSPNYKSGNGASLFASNHHVSSAGILVFPI